MNLPVEKRRQWIRSRREQRKLTKMARLRRQLLRYIALVVIIFCGTAAFYKMHWYCNQTICIEGNSVVSNEQVLQVIRKSINQPLFALNPANLEKKIESLSVVKKAFVRRYALPYPQLQIQVLEEFPWASLYLGDSPDPQFVIAQSGRPISIKEFPRVHQPALKIYEPSKNDMKFTVEDVSRWNNWISYIEKQTQYTVSSVDMRDQNNVKVETSKFILALGSADNSLTSRLHRLASVLDILACEKKEPTYVNLGLNSNIPIKLAKKSDKTDMQNNKIPI